MAVEAPKSSPATAYGRSGPQRQPANGKDTQTAHDPSTAGGHNPRHTPPGRRRSTSSPRSAKRPADACKYHVLKHEVLQTPYDNDANDELHTSVRCAIIGLIAQLLLVEIALKSHQRRNRVVHKNSLSARSSDIS